MSGIQIDLDDYLLVINEDGTAYQEDPDFLYIQHRTTQEVQKAEYAAAAPYYGISKASSSNSGLHKENKVFPRLCSLQTDNAATPPLDIVENEDDNKMSSANADISGSEYSECTVSTRSTGVIWSHGETKLMLSLYNEYFKQVGPMQKLKTKKALWKIIAKEMKSRLGFEFTVAQIENKYKTVSRQHKKTLNNNRTSGASRITPEFPEEFREIAAFDDSLEPEVRMDTSSIEIKRSYKASTSASSSPEPKPGPSTRKTIYNRSTSPSASPEVKAGPSSKKPRQMDVQQQMLEAFKQSQMDKNRRHQERMERMDVMTALLTRIAEKP